MFAKTYNRSKNNDIGSGLYILVEIQCTLVRSSQECWEIDICCLLTWDFLLGCTGKNSEKIFVFFSNIYRIFSLKMSIFFLKSAIWEKMLILRKKVPNFGEKDIFFKKKISIFCMGGARCVLRVKWVKHPLKDLSKLPMICHGLHCDFIFIFPKFFQFFSKCVAVV